MNAHLVPGFSLFDFVAAIVVAFLYIVVFSLVKELSRQKMNAVIIAGAGAVYWSGGLGVWEYFFSAIMILVAFKGLTHYYFIAIGWLLHTCWDIVHHLYANPIISFIPTSSAQCAVCDFVLAIWFFYQAPSIFSGYYKTIKA